MPQTTIQKRFSAAAATYDLHADVQRCVANALVSLLPPDPADPILEVGCGTGYLTKQLLAHFPRSRIHALDISSRMIDRARKKLREEDRIQWFEGDIAAYRPGIKYSLLVSNAALHWVAPLRKAFTETRRLVERGGLVVCSMMVDGTLGELREARLHVAPHRPPMGRLPGTEEVADGMNEVGFTIETWRDESIAAEYTSTRALLRAIHQMGLTGGAVSRSATPLQRGDLERLLQHYDAQYGTSAGTVRATYRVVFLRARVG